MGKEKYLVSYWPKCELSRHAWGSDAHHGLSCICSHPAINKKKWMRHLEEISNFQIDPINLQDCSRYYCHTNSKISTRLPLIWGACCYYSLTQNNYKLIWEASTSVIDIFDTLNIILLIHVRYLSQLWSLAIFLELSLFQTFSKGKDKVPSTCLWMLSRDELILIREFPLKRRQNTNQVPEERIMLRTIVWYYVTGIYLVVIFKPALFITSWHPPLNLV